MKKILISLACLIFLLIAPYVQAVFIGDTYYGSEMLAGADLVEYDQDNSSVVCAGDTGDNTCLAVWEDCSTANCSDTDIYGQFLDYDESNGSRYLVRSYSRIFQCNTNSCWTRSSTFGNYNFPVIEGSLEQISPSLAFDGTNYLVV
jgi:hypothetical protein